VRYSRQQHEKDLERAAPDLAQAKDSASGDADVRARLVRGRVEECKQGCARI